MPDDDVPGDRRNTRGAAQGGVRHDSAFGVSSLFAHPEYDAVAAAVHDDVGALFAAPAAGAPKPTAGPAPAADPGLHLTAPTALMDTAEGHLFEDAETASHSYAHSFPAPAPARPQPQHAAPRFGLGRPLVIAMAAGLVVTALGAGWAMAAPETTVPVAVSPAATPTVDSARIAKVDESIDALANAVKAAQAHADSFTAPLAAMAGASNESARLAADAARQAYVAALAAVRVPARAGTTATAAVLDHRERDIAAGQATLAAATAGFRGAITTFRQSFPAFAAVVVADHPDAARAYRTAVIDAAVAVAASDPSGPTPFAALDAWRSALVALLADQARAVAEARSTSNSNSSNVGTSPGTGTGGTPTTGQPAPQQPAPQQPVYSVPLPPVLPPPSAGAPAPTG